MERTQSMARPLPPGHYSRFPQWAQQEDVGSPHEPYTHDRMENLGTPQQQHYVPPDPTYVPRSPNEAESGSNTSTPVSRDLSPKSFFNRHTRQRLEKSKSDVSSTTYEGRSVCSNCSMHKVKLITALFLMCGGVLSALYAGYRSFSEAKDDDESRYDISKKWNIMIAAGFGITLFGAIFCLCCVPPGTCTNHCCCCKCCCKGEVTDMDGYPEYPPSPKETYND